MKRFTFICGGVPPPAQQPDEHVLLMDVQGPARNVNLRVSDISRSMMSNLPDLLLDLLEIAAYVYCADQRASRGSEKLSLAGAMWQREMAFVIPVRCWEVWAGADLTAALVETLSFLSDDRYSFEFVRSPSPMAERELYFDNFTDGRFEPEDVVLFSGGVDSLAGAVENIAGFGRRTVLVGHHSAPKVVSIQNELVSELRTAGLHHKLFHVTVNVTNTEVKPIEPTQRARSFLFASLGFVLARMFGLTHFTFYENGVVSLNLPIAGDVLGARATRTTHPRVMRGFEKIFSCLAEQEIEVRTPFLWLTKKEVVERLIELGFGNLLENSVSCVHPMIWTREVYHCGACSQCIDRRFAVLAAGAEESDPASGYAIDLLTDDRSGEDHLRLSVAYVQFARAIATIERGRLLQHFPSLASVLRSIRGMSGERVGEQVEDLHRRHAAGVLGVLTQATRQHAGDLAAGKLPAGSLLSLCFTKDRIETPLPDICAQVESFMDQLSPPVCDVALDEAGKKIWFKGGFSIDGAKFRLVRALLTYQREAKRKGEPAPYFWTAELAEHLEVDDNALRTTVSRLRRELEAKLATDQGIVFSDGFIENVKAKGYRLAPDIREVSLADMERPMSQSKSPMSQEAPSKAAARPF